MDDYDLFVVNRPVKFRHTGFIIFVSSKCRRLRQIQRIFFLAVIIIIDSMTLVFNTDTSLPYNHDLFESLIVKKRIKVYQGATPRKKHLIADTYPVLHSPHHQSVHFPIPFSILKPIGIHRPCCSAYSNRSPSKPVSLLLRFRLSIRKRLFCKRCNTLSVSNCHATGGKHEGWDTARLPQPRQGKSRSRGRIRTTNLPVSLIPNLVAGLGEAILQAIHPGESNMSMGSDDEPAGSSTLVSTNVANLFVSVMELLT
ncbi:hypothetical protein CLF_113295, partial [Clonorchis sinensis]